METHGTIAQWDGDRLTLHDSSQWVFGVRDGWRRSSASRPSSRVIVPFIGGAFGERPAWSHVALAAMAAKLVDRPGEVRRHAPADVRLGRPSPADRATRRAWRERRRQLVSMTHDVLSETSLSDEFVEPCGVFSRDLYAVTNYAHVARSCARLNISKPTYQRGPGESTGSFAMESAMDELAYELRFDPLELRLRNYAETDPDRATLLQQASARVLPSPAERFEWSAASRSRARCATGTAARRAWAWRRRRVRRYRSAASARIA